MLNKCRTWMEVDLDAILFNYQESCKLLKPNCKVIAIVKADSYGLGAVPIAKTLEAAGCGFFGVAFFDEAMELRANGISSRILTLAPVSMSQLDDAVENKLEVPVVSYDQAKQYSDYLSSNGKTLAVHIKLDLGLSRIGIVLSNRFSEAKNEIKQIFSLPGLNVVAVMGHITGSYGAAGDAFNRRQLQLFNKMVYNLLQEGYFFEKHCLSSQPFIMYPEYSYDYVRLGAILYGSLPGVNVPFRLNPVVGLYTRIIQLKTVPEGTPISYGPEYFTLRKTIVATVGIGFSDGIRRSIVNGGKVLLHGKPVLYIGKLCSDYAMLDVTDVPNAREGDIVTIFGESEGLRQGIEDYAAIYPASVSETTASITKRVPRFYIHSKA